MLVVSINAESWKECATTSIVCPQERSCIAELCGKKGSFIGCIAYKTGKDSSSVCHKVEKNERHKRFSACAAQKEGSCPPTADTGRKGGAQILRSLIVEERWSPKQAGDISGSSMAAGASLSLSTILQAGPGRHSRVARCATICAGRGRGSAARGLRPKARSRSHTA